ncbi:MAG: hypothetical protein ACTSXD_11615 [Candidatus Heimdallarchaeaceae archaeon]
MADKFVLREKLADLEHRQWAYWMRYMLPNINEKNIRKWAGQTLRFYSDLTEKEKESDREWADKVLILFEEWKEEFIKQVASDLRKKEYPFTYDDIMKIIKKRAGTLGEQDGE